MTSLIQKLQIKADMQGAVFETPPEVNLGLADDKRAEADYAIAFVQKKK